MLHCNLIKKAPFLKVNITCMQIHANKKINKWIKTPHTHTHTNYTWKKKPTVRLIIYAYTLINYKCIHFNSIFILNKKFLAKSYFHNPSDEK